jgi:tetratricopeptide (TPR) repeat protein
MTRQGRSSEALEACTEGFSSMTSATPSNVKAQAYMFLSSALCSEGSMLQATEAAMTGLKYLDAVNFSMLAAFLYGMLVFCYQKRGLLDHSLHAADEGLKVLDLTPESSSSVVLSLYSSTSYLMQSRLSNSFRIMEQILKSDTIVSGECRLQFAQAVLFQGDFSRALTLLEAELHYSFGIVEKTEQHHARVAAFMGRIETRQENYTTAWAHLRTSHNSLKSRDDYSCVLPLMSMGDWSLAQNKTTHSINYFVLCALIARKHHDRILLSTTLMRIGDVFYYQRRTDEAKACYDLVLDLIRYLGLRRHLGDCLFRLGIVDQLRGDDERAAQRVSRARMFYQDAEVAENSRMCEAWLADNGNETVGQILSSRYFLGTYLI